MEFLRFTHQQININNISVMKSNKGVAALPKSKERMLVTTDVNNVLQVLNRSNFWKNSTNKIDISKNIKVPGTTTGNRKINQMTEDQIDNLFSSKSKKKLITQYTKADASSENHNYLDKIQFLTIANSYDRLLSGLSQVQLTSPQTKFQQQNDNNKKQDLTQMFKKNFLVGKIIGEGAYASVRVAVSKKINKKVAIKVYQKNKIKEPQRKRSVRREIRILQELDHLNIVKIYDVVETNNHLNIVMQHLDGISLNNFLKHETNHRISENKCKKIIKGLASALKYLHQMYIAHRDLKLQNIILDDSLNPKLIDFGFSTCLGKDKKIKIFCGTPSYMAPQIIQKKEYIGQKADIWALGVLFFVCITGIFPFKGSTDEQLYSKINKADFVKSELAFSKQITDLISKMLKINPDQRITAYEILNHPWLKDENSHLDTQNTQASQSKKKHKGKESISTEYRKRVATMSSHKSKQSWNNKEIMRLTETYKQNLKLELRLAKQSPIVAYNNTCTNIKFEKQNGSRTFIKSQKDRAHSRLETSGYISFKGQKSKRDKNKNDNRVIDLFKTSLKGREQKQQSKNKNKRN